LYKNGVLQASSTTTLWISTTLKDLYIGSLTGGNSTMTDMYLDDFEVYNTALNEQAIYGLYGVQSTLGTHVSNAPKLKMMLYPNPASEYFNIDMQGDVKSVEIYAANGQKVMSATTKKIYITGLTSGLYWVKIIDKNNVITTQKLLVK
jgi:hypothetical protein